VAEVEPAVVVNLSAPVGAAIADGQGRATIADDDPVPQIAIDDLRFVEGSSGATTNAVLTVRLSAPSGRSVTVKYATADGTAAAPADYTAKALTTLTIAAGKTTGTISIPVKGDATAEADEAFTVNLSAPTNATIADSQAVVTIVNDDGSPLRLVGGADGGRTPPAGLTAALLAPIVDAAIARWDAAGVGPAGLAAMRRASVQMADLPDDELGLASADAVVIDRDAAGAGWYVDPTPYDDREFSGGRARGLAGRGVDLLTVVLHELGHVRGLGHNDVMGDPMGETVAVGERRVPEGPATDHTQFVSGPLHLAKGFKLMSFRRRTR